MDIENSAQGAPRGRFAHSPTGFRRMTPGLLKADRAAERFAGLPEGVKSPGQLLAALKAAAPRLGISPRLVHAVDWLFRFTQPQDWRGQPADRMAVGLDAAGGARPFAVAGQGDQPAPDRARPRDDEGQPERQTLRPPAREDRAYHRGLRLRSVAGRHAPCGIRASRGGGKGGACRHGRLRRRATIARKAITQILETAQEYGFAGEEWISLARETAVLARVLRGAERPDEMEIGVKSLERRQIAARERLEILLGVVDSAPKQPENRPHNTITNQTLILTRIP